MENTELPILYFIGPILYYCLSALKVIFFYLSTIILICLIKFLNSEEDFGYISAVIAACILNNWALELFILAYVFIGVFYIYLDPNYEYDLLVRAWIHGAQYILVFLSLFVLRNIVTYIKKI